MTPGAFTLAMASGKGGTGKTLIATNLAAILARTGLRVVLVDCDVEAPNDHLFLEPVDAEIEEVVVPLAEADQTLCTACGACRDACAYGAPRILGGNALVFGELCHGCGLCSAVCPTGAMRQVPRVVGEVESGSARVRGLSLVAGRLSIGDVKAPEVIRAARRQGSERAADVMVLDAPPGVSCSAVASVHGADALLLVAEPTPFGLHDLALTVELGRQLDISMAAMANRATKSAIEGPGGLAELCAGWRIPLVGRVPFDRRIAEAYAEGRLAVDHVPGFAAHLGPVAATVAGMRTAVTNTPALAGDAAGAS